MPEYWLFFFMIASPLRVQHQQPHRIVYFSWRFTEYLHHLKTRNSSHQKRGKKVLTHFIGDLFESRSFDSITLSLYVAHPISSILNQPTECFPSSNRNNIRILGKNTCSLRPWPCTLYQDLLAAHYTTANLEQPTALVDSVLKSPI